MKLDTGTGVPSWLIRIITPINFAILVVDVITPYSFLPHRILRSPRIYDAAFYWLIFSTACLFFLLLLQVRRRMILKLDKPPSGIWIDAVLVLAWLITVVVGLARSLGPFV